MSKKRAKKTEEPKKEDSIKQEVNQQLEDNSDVDELQLEKEKFLRLFAEFENYKKRTARERIELFTTASEELMTSLLPILDDFDRANAEIEKNMDNEIFKGVILIQNKFKDVLTSKGLSLIEVKKGDEFNADNHEAVTQIEAPSAKLKGKIIDVIEKGYKLGEKIIRYPKVVIGK
jgi:molecular chaperone GrpE